MTSRRHDSASRGGGKTPGTHRKYSLTAKLTEQEMVRAKECAARAGLSPAEWARHIVNLAADPLTNLLVTKVAVIRELLVGLLLHLTSGGREMTIAQLRDLAAKAEARAIKRSTALATAMFSPAPPVAEELAQLAATAETANPAAPGGAHRV